MQNDKTLIGVTGGIGSGKTLVCKFLAKMGCKVYYADNIAKELYKKNATLKKRLIQSFGVQILDRRKKISLLKLGDIVFRNKLSQQRVGKIVHPFVIYEIMKRIGRNSNRFIVVEAALIFETHFDRYLDFTILVNSNIKERIKRIAHRDKVSEGKIRKILRLQMPEIERFKRADFIVKNNGTRLDLQNNVKKVLQKIKQNTA